MKNHAFLLLSLLLITACGNEEPATYQVPKEAPPPAIQTPAPRHRTCHTVPWSSMKARIAAERMRSSLGTQYTSTFIYAPFLLVGILRWRLKKSRALVAGSDSVADEMLAVTEQVIQDISLRIGRQPQLKKYRIILLDVVEELKGQGTNPNLLLDLETMT